MTVIYGRNKSCITTNIKKTLAIKVNLCNRERERDRQTETETETETERTRDVSPKHVIQKKRVGESEQS